MARKRNKKSKLSFDGLRLSHDEEKSLKEILDEKKLSMAQVKRMLVREWIKNPTVTI